MPYYIERDADNILHVLNCLIPETTDLHALDYNGQTVRYSAAYSEYPQLMQIWETTLVENGIDLKIFEEEDRRIQKFHCLAIHKVGMEMEDLFISTAMLDDPRLGEMSESFQKRDREGRLGEFAESNLSASWTTPHKPGHHIITGLVR
jgi:hypothetical protein